MKKITKQQIIQIMENELFFLINNNLPNTFGRNEKVNSVSLAHMRKICENITTDTFNADTDSDATDAVCDHLMSLYSNFPRECYKAFNNARFISASAMEYSYNYYSTIVYEFIKTLLDIFLGAKEPKH